MKIIGFNLKKMSVETQKPIKSKVEIQRDISITDVREANNELFKDKKTLLIDFDFKVNYLPDYANLLIQGGLILLIEDNEKNLGEEILESWKDKKLPDEANIVLLNLIFSRCNLKALQLEEDLGLPPHLQLPRFTLPKENSEEAKA